MGEGEHRKCCLARDTSAATRSDSAPNEDRPRTVRREQPTDIARIAREQYVSGPGNDGDVSIADIRGARATTDFTHLAGDCIERRQNAVGESAGQANLRARTAPDLRQDGRRNDHLGITEGGQLERRPDVPIVPLEGDQGTGIQDEPTHRLRGGLRTRSFRSIACNSSGVRTPCSASQSPTTESRPFERSFRRAASASHAEVASDPAARRTSRASFLSNEIANRATLIPRYYCSATRGQGVPGTMRLDLTNEAQAEQAQVCPIAVPSVLTRTVRSSAGEDPGREVVFFGAFSRMIPTE